MAIVTVGEPDCGGVSDEGPCECRFATGRDSGLVIPAGLDGVDCAKVFCVKAALVRVGDDGIDSVEGRAVLQVWRSRWSKHRWMGVLDRKSATARLMIGSPVSTISLPGSVSVSGLVITYHRSRRGIATDDVRPARGRPHVAMPTAGRKRHCSCECPSRGRVRQCTRTKDRHRRHLRDEHGWYQLQQATAGGRGRSGDGVKKQHKKYDTRGNGYLGDYS